MIIYVDIDGILCDTEGMDYKEARPIKRNIDKINEKYNEGHRIVIWTARGMLTGKNWRNLTEKQLKEWGVKYHELKMDKPFFDLLIDDRTENLKEGDEGLCGFLAGILVTVVVVVMIWVSI